MFKNREICMEVTHGRKSKRNTEFKAVVNKILISTLVMATVLGSASPAFAANTPSLNLSSSGQSYSQEYGISVESAIANIRSTIEVINTMKANGTVSESALRTLASQLYSLETSVKVSKIGVTIDVKNVITEAEKAIKNVPNATEVKAAIAVVKANLGIDSVTVQSKKASLKSFSDVAPGHWAYEAIMDMAINRGMINGTVSPDANGVGQFAPNASMTRAQFITIVTRYLYPDELAAFEKAPDDPWYMANYVVAIQEGLLHKSDFALSEMNVPMTRQEMAMVLVKAMNESGESIDIQVVKDSRIPDYNQIGTKYREFVKIAYTKGLIVGTDSKGTFSPLGTLNRAQAATVIYRLLEEGTRSPVDIKEEVKQEEQEQENVQANGYSWVEGEFHNPPKVGDTVIKADGTKVVLKIGPGGVLGAGQGVNIWAGVYKEGECPGVKYTGDGTPLVYNAYSGEMHTQTQWKAIRGATHPWKESRDIKGKDGEIRNIFWKWSDMFMEWVWIGG